MPPAATARTNPARTTRPRRYVSVGDFSSYSKLVLLVLRAVESSFIKQSHRSNLLKGAAYGLLVLNSLIIGYFWWHSSGQVLLNGSGEWLRGLGRLFGLLAAFSIILDFVLIARLPFLETAFGRALQTRWHKTVGYAAFVFIVAHFTFLTIGYATVNKLSLVAQFLSFATTYEDVLKTILAFLLLCVVVGLSIYFVRRHVKYETWYFVHLLTYLVIILAFGHQMKVGTDFLQQPIFRIYWWTLYVALFGIVVVFRFIKPLYVSLKYRLHVDQVVSETPDVHSIYFGGSGIERLRYQPGQFAIWRFLDKERWWQGHPFSITSQPGDPQLRISFKQSGDFTATLSKVKAGTPVILDGPSGRFTAEATAAKKILLIAGGIGITPLADMLPTMVAQGRNIVLLYSARTEADLALRAEIEKVAARGQVKVTYVITDDLKYQGVTGMLDQAKLSQLVPDAANRAVYVCGPPPMMAAISQSLIKLGVPAQAIFTEKFSF